MLTSSDIYERCDVIREDTCYISHRTTLSWFNAQHVCEEESGTLARVPDSNVHAILTALVLEDESADFWIGGTAQEELEWIWLDQGGTCC